MEKLLKTIKNKIKLIILSIHNKYLNNLINIFANKY